MPDQSFGFKYTSKLPLDLYKKQAKYNLSEPLFMDKTGLHTSGTLQILSSNLIAKFNVSFKDLFPYSLSTISFDATDTDIQYFTADVSFKYTIYNITDLSGNNL